MANEVTMLLSRAVNGDARALDELLPLVYDELRRMAASHVSRERQGQSLQATALVHEAYVKLVQADQVTWQNRAHFFGVAARLMRQILVDRARERSAEKRGGALRHVTFEEAIRVTADDAEIVLFVDQALQRLAALDRRQADIVDMRFFGGLSVEETAEALKIGPATVKRDWAMARAWLGRELIHHSGGN